MFDYDLELKKFKPAVGVEIGEDELFSDDIKDITDLVEELVAEREGKKASMFSRFTMKRNKWSASRREQILQRLWF